MFAVPTCLALLAVIGLPVAEAVKCHDCVGKNCMGAFCNGDYCMHSQYAPRWGTIEWGVPKIVKGCISGAMLRRDLRDHCETVDEDGQVGSIWTSMMGGGIIEEEKRYIE
jgi:hypothetical protein